MLNVRGGVVKKGVGCSARGYVLCWTGVPMEELGFTLLELVVIVAIVGILTFAGMGAVLSADSEVRSRTFSMMADFNFARSEAVKRGQDVLVDLLVEGETDDDGMVRSADGYRICIDEDGDGNCDLADTSIKDVLFDSRTCFYDDNIPAPVGPDRSIDGDLWVASDGVSFTGNRFVLTPEGRSNKAGTVYLYVPGGKNGIRGGVMAVVLNRIGRIRIASWKRGSQAWQRK